MIERRGDGGRDDREEEMEGEKIERGGMEGEKI